MDFDNLAAKKPPQEVAESEPHVYSVSELNHFIRQKLESDFHLLWIRGEISNFKAHSSGHFYFSLKDKKCQVSAVMFRGFNSRLLFRPEDGMEVLVRGKVTVYEPRGSYQVFCELMEPVGAGALQMAFEQLKAKLQKEGLFAAERKRPLPALPKTIALVTSPTGAAVRDMLNVLGRRFRGVNIFVVPCLVQGQQAPSSIVSAIGRAQSIPHLDVMIIGRGGGSMEDLWAFNDEGVARAIAGASVPVISAVGHEVDFTIADFVADLRAPTPSAAAELVVKNAADLTERVRSMTNGLVQCMRYKVAGVQKHLEHLDRRLVDPRRRLQDLIMRCDELNTRLSASMRRWLVDRRRHVEWLHKKMPRPQEMMADLKNRMQVAEVKLHNFMGKVLQKKTANFATLAGILDSLSPLKVVERGYSIISKNGHIVKDARQLKPGDSLRLRFAVGEAEAEVKEVK